MHDADLYERPLDRLTRPPGVDACWVWTGGKNAGGYGQIYESGKRVLVHRSMWRAFKGPDHDFRGVATSYGL